MTSTTTLHDTAARTRPGWSRLLRAEVLDRVRLIRREPATLFFTVLLPVALFAMFAALFGGDTTGNDGRTVGTTMLATSGAYGVIAATLLVPALGLSEDRERGWYEVVRVSPVPVPLVLLGSVLATIPYAIGVLGGMTAAAAALGVLDIGVVQWVGVAAGVVGGGLTFSFLGLTVGALLSPNSATAALNALVFPLAIGGGLWFPLDILPSWVASLALWLPTYHVARLGLVPLQGGAWVSHVVYLAVFAALGAVLATLAYRRSTT